MWLLETHDFIRIKAINYERIRRLKSRVDSQLEDLLQIHDFTRIRVISFERIRRFKSSLTPVFALAVANVRGFDAKTEFGVSGSQTFD
jgi:hypothetical protein